MEELVKKFLTEIGEDTNREGLLKTPKRVEQAIKFLTQGYSQNEEEIINGALFESNNHEIIIVKDIEFYSLCEHHILPFYGKVSIAYIPDKKIIGLSKFCRVVEMYSRRLQVQERLTSDIANCLNKWLKPKGIVVYIEAFHLCISMRGVRNQNANTVTLYSDGVFKGDSNLKNQFLQKIEK